MQFSISQSVRSVVGLVIVLALCAFGINPAAAQSGATKRGGGDLCSQGKIKIGDVAILSGVLGYYGTVAHNTQALAVELVNKQGGINGCKVEMVTKDMKSDPALAAQIAREFLRSGMQLLLLPTDLDLGISAGQAANAQGVFSMAPGGASDGYGAAVGKLFANGGTISSEQADAAARFAKESGYDSVYYVTLDRFDYFNAMEARFKKASGLKDVGRSAVAPGQTDFAAVVTDIKRQLSSSGGKPFIYMTTIFPDGATFVNQLRQAGVSAPVVGSAAFSSPDLTKALGPNTKDVYYTAGAYYEGDDLDADAAAFVAAYKAKYGVMPMTLSGVETYWAVQALFDALKVANSTEGSAVAKALFAQKNHKVPMKTIARWESGHIIGSTVIIGFTPEGKFRKVVAYPAMQ